jgi:DNA-binding PucR family transcriptional regulator
LSITISEILKLPSLQGAKVVAGKEGLDRRVSTISVSEYTWGLQFKDVYFDSYASEIVISAFYAVKDNVEKQCQNIEEYNAGRVAGLILFYVGVILPYVDDRIVALANKLGFPIIVMPENRPDLRYGDVIYEVTEAILKSRMFDYDFVNNIIEQVSRFPEHQQSVGAVMRMLRDKTFSTIILADSAGEPLNAAVWPRNLAVEDYLANRKVIYGDETVQLHDETYNVYVCSIKSSSGIPLQTVIYKRGERLSPDVVRQIGETIQISMNLWDRGHSEKLRVELVGAILKDEPYKIRRIAALFSIHIQDIQNMWIICPTSEDKAERFLKNVPRLISNVFSQMSGTVVFDIFDGNIIVLMDTGISADKMMNAAQDFCDRLSEHNMAAIVTICRNLDSLTKIRKAYLANKSALATAREIYPLKTLFSFSEIKFADKCKKIIDSGENAINQNMEILDMIPKDGRVSSDDMIKTISTYYLDAQSDITLTGKILFLHKNTIQYRIHKIQERIYDGLDKLPEISELYLALALNRILKDSMMK